MHNTKISYLISRYPAISHTFILREVLHLKSMGLELITASINKTNRNDEKLTQEEVEEKKLTYYVKADGLIGAIKSKTALVFRSPLKLFKTFFYAIKTAGPNLKMQLYHQLYLIEAIMVAEWMHKNSSNNLHVHFASEVATVGMFVKKLNDCHLSITAHGPDEFYNADKYLLGEKINSADKIFCISDFARSQLMKLSEYDQWGKFCVTRLGVNVDAFKPSTGSTNQSPNILSVGRLCPAKAQHILIEAAAILAKAGLDFTVTFVGDGPDRSSLEELCKSLSLNEIITFTGSVNHDEVKGFYDKCDIFCLPSFAEGIPIVLMEAMSKEIPCVTSRITGIPELIDSGVDGFLTAPSNAEELARALQKLIENNALRVETGKAARTKVIEKYHLENNMSYFGEKLEEAVTRKN